MRNHCKFVVLLGLFLIVPSVYLLAQVGINADNSSPDNSAMLDVKSTNKGLLPPRMTHAQMNTIEDPANGLIIYCTDCSNSGSGALAMFMDGLWYIYAPTCLAPLFPSTGIHIPAPTQIIWNWNPVTHATGYKWNTINDYNSATDMGTATTRNQTGLTCNIAYTSYAWAYNACGNSSSITLTSATSSCGTFACGENMAINHIAGLVAPVTKTTTYGTVTNIPGELTKCWITSNLGSDHSATAVSDATEASAGWYWQFNRKQGYTHDGTARTPNTTWMSTISETSDWITANDPCNIELGTTWRIPTYTEWYNVDNAGGWSTWTGPWSSGLKLHAAGDLYYTSGSLVSRGSTGNYWSSTQGGSTGGWQVGFSTGNSGMYNAFKAYGFSTRCVREICSSIPNAPTAGTHVPLQTQITWNWNTVAGATGYKWGTVNNFAEANDMGASTTTTETGLTCNTPNTRYVWAYSGCGYSLNTPLDQSTIPCIVLPDVTTTAVTSITQTTAISGGTVTSDGGGTVTEHGVCWSLSPNPTTSDFKTADGSGTGVFTSNLTMLSAGTLYYLKAYATNSAGTAYGDQLSFTTPSFAVGQSYGGGIIFYIDGTGQHGLIAAASDQGGSLWGCQGTNQGTSTAMFTGQANTTNIVNGCAATNCAARLCDNLVLNGYSDWFLPSKDELNQMYLQKNAIGGFVGDIYWTSSQSGSSYAWGQMWIDGSQIGYYLKNDQHPVRAIRAF